MFCKDCKYWERYRSTESGVCSEIMDSSKILIHLVLGWDGGYIHEIETDSDFGCVLFEEK